MRIIPNENVVSGNRNSTEREEYQLQLKQRMYLLEG